MTITEATEHLGKRVAYRNPEQQRRHGKIKSVSTTVVYVQLDGDEFMTPVDPADLVPLTETAP